MAQLCAKGQVQVLSFSLWSQSLGLVWGIQIFQNEQRVLKGLETVPPEITKL